MEAAIWGFIGTLIGALASLGTTWVTARNAALLHASTSKLEREEKFRIFQRDTLIELQDALHDLMRLIAQGHHEDVMAFKETGVWGKNFLTSEISEGQRLARRKVSILMERVADNKLRKNLQELNSSLTDVGWASSQENAFAKWDDASNQGHLTMQSIGELLRAQY